MAGTTIRAGDGGGADVPGFLFGHGFATKAVVLVPAAYSSVELPLNKRAYRVIDLTMMGTRIGLVSGCAVMMTVHATKFADVALFRQPLPPEQLRVTLEYQRFVRRGTFARDARSEHARAHVPGAALWGCAPAFCSCASSIAV